MDSTLNQIAQAERQGKALKIAAALVCLMVAGGVAFYILALGPRLNPLDQRAAQQERDSYANQALNLRFSLPAGWEFLTQETTDALFQAGAEFAGVDTEDTGAKVLMMAVDMTTGSNVQIAALYNDTEAEEIVEAAATMAAEAIGGAYEVQRQDSVELGGHSYQVARITLKDQGMEIYYVGGNVRDYLVHITLAGRMEEDVLQFLTAFSALR